MSRSKNNRGWLRSKELWGKRPLSYHPAVKYWRKKCAKAEREIDRKVIAGELKP